MDNSTYNEQLMRYIDGEMTEGERKEFESLAANDPSLQQAIDNMQLARAAVTSYGLKQRVGNIHQQMMKELNDETPVKPISNVRRIIRYTVAIAASVLLIVVGIEGYNFYRLNPNRLFAENYAAYELTTTRDVQTTESPIEKAYREKKYDEVIKLNASNVVTIKEVFLTGMAYLETNDLSRAISSYQIAIIDIKDDKNSVVKDAAEYYLALAFLKNRDYDQAIELMNAIHDNSSHLYKEKFTRKYINRVKRLKWR